MTVSRIYIDNFRATVSKPGIDAAASVSNPDYKFLSLDSRLDSALPLEVGFRSGVSIGTKVYYAGSYGSNIVPDFVMYTYGTISGFTIVSAAKYTMQRDDNGKDVVFRTACNAIFESDGFTIADSVFYERSPAIPSSFNVAYMLWRL